MEQSLSTIIDRIHTLGVGVSAYIKVHCQFLTMFMQTNQEILYHKEKFQNMHLGFLDALGHVQNDPASVDDTETTTPRTPTCQDHSKRSILSG